LGSTIGGQTAVGYHALRNSTHSGQFCFGNTLSGLMRWRTATTVAATRPSGVLPSLTIPAAAATLPLAY
jgi:hypothetical protein